MPGAGKQTPEVQARIKELLEAGFDPTTIHRKLKVGRSSIYRMKRCLQQHGSAYMPTEMNKKNGRPKVLSGEQELEVREWLRDDKNRNRYLDDLVWLIHDRFGIISSTTTMSKLRRKWIKVIEAEENGTPLDDATRQLVMETHPTLPILHQQGASQTATMGSMSQVEMSSPQQAEDNITPQPELAQARKSGRKSRSQQHTPVQQQPYSEAVQQPQQHAYEPPPQQDPITYQLPYGGTATHQPPHIPMTYEEPIPSQLAYSQSYPQMPPYPYTHQDPQIDARLLQQTDPRYQQAYQYSMAQYGHSPQPHMDLEMASAGATRQ